MRFGILVAASVVFLWGCSLPISAIQRSAANAAPKLPQGTVLFKDDFSSPISGWDRTQYDQGIMDYDRGGYRILVNAQQANFWSTPHKDFADVRVEADAGKLGGPDENRLGLICRSDGRSYYFFIITSDGYYGVGMFSNGQATLLGQAEMRSNPAIITGAAINHLRLDCSGANLQAYVNDVSLASVSDSTLAHGDVGLLAGTFGQPGADIVFDNFVVMQP
jgi:hypothetical protein